jgi:hypothetical protein
MANTETQIFERPNITACEDYTFMKSYCDTGDVYCDSGDIRSVHGGYLGHYGTEVVTDVLKAWNKATDGDVDTSGGPSFGEGSSGNTTETPAATPSATTSSTMTSTQTQTETETSTETGSGDGQGGGNEPDAAVGLSAMGSLLIGAPVMMLALWNVL